MTDYTENLSNTSQFIENPDIQTRTSEKELLGDTDEDKQLRESCLRTAEEVSSQVDFNYFFKKISLRADITTDDELV